MNRRSFLGLCAGAIAASAFPHVLIPANGGRITSVRPTFKTFEQAFIPAYRLRVGLLMEEMRRRFEEIGNKYVNMPVDDSTRVQMQTELMAIASAYQADRRIVNFSVQPNYYRDPKVMGFTSSIIPSNVIERYDINMSVHTVG